MIHARPTRCWLWMEDCETKAKSSPRPKCRHRRKHAGLMLEFALMLALALLLPRGRK
jgi:hypothetical protein